MLADDDEEALSRQLISEEERCMSAQGFVVSLSLPALSPSRFSLRMRYGAIPTAVPQRWGYRDPDRAARAVEAANSQPKFTKEEAVAFFGTGMVDEGGSSTSPACLPTALKVVYGNTDGLAGLPGYSDLMQIQIDSNSQLYADAQAQVLMQSWSSCMSKAGFSFKNWWEARDQFVVDPTSLDNISEEEKAAATADLECRRSVDLEAGLLGIESRIQEKLLDKRSASVEAYSQARKELLKRVATS